jgi:hypothetical protein
MSPGHALLDRLAGTDCRFCGGAVAPGEYKGNAAAVCGACGTPAVQLF